MVEIVLGLDVVQIAFVGMMRSGIRLGDKLEDGGEGDWSGEEGNDPNAEDLMHGDIKTKCLRIKSCVECDQPRFVWARRLDNPLGIAKLTNAFNVHFYSRAHDLVPTVNIPYQPPRAIEATGPTEGMCEGGGGRKVLFHRCALFLRR